LSAWSKLDSSKFVIGAVRSVGEVREVHQTGGLPVCFLEPFDDVRRVSRICELDGDGAVDVQFFDRLNVRLEFDHVAARGYCRPVRNSFALELG
jgi:hypothetical protein